MVGIGALPNTSLAKAAGLALNNGVMVDEHLLGSGHLRRRGHRQRLPPIAGQTHPHQALVQRPQPTGRRGQIHVGPGCGI
ncbi:hypothetical protein [Arthrobacter livingstonensis]|uniref:hypothetical protein n=1 Tax=Arthrobacter livingstonensis TaxID=670078 RepID=UPI0034D2B11C